MEKITCGYIARVKDKDKALSVVYGSAGSQTKTFITDDPSKVHLFTDKWQAEMMIQIFNKSHVNKVEFEISKVQFIQKINLNVLEKEE